MKTGRKISGTTILTPALCRTSASRQEGEKRSQRFLRYDRRDGFNETHQLAGVFRRKTFAKAGLFAGGLKAGEPFDLAGDFRERQVFRQLVDKLDDNFPAAHNDIVSRLGKNAR
jgi:hypothetical protein